jgi:hypothetical protein
MKGKNMDTSRMLRDIQLAKLRLVKQYQEKGICENFGDKEVRKLRDKYGTDYTFRRTTQPINDFAEWCMNFTGKEV